MISWLAISAAISVALSTAARDVPHVARSVAEAVVVATAHDDRNDGILRRPRAAVMQKIPEAFQI
jgi:hypothetical protein